MTESKRQKTISAAFAPVFQQGAAAGRPLLAQAAQESLFPREASLGVVYVDLTTWQADALVHSLEHRLLGARSPAADEGNQWFMELLGALWGASLRSTVPPHTVAAFSGILGEWSSRFHISAPVAGAPETLPAQLAREDHERTWTGSWQATKACIHALGEEHHPEYSWASSEANLIAEAEQREAALFRSLFERRLRRPPPQPDDAIWRSFGPEAFGLVASRCQWTLLRALSDSGTLHPVERYDVGVRLAVALSLAGRRNDAKAALIAATQRWTPLYWGPVLPPEVLTLRTFRNILDEEDIARVVAAGRPATD